MNPPYVSERMVTSGEKYLTVLHIDPTLPPIYVGEMWDHIPKERFSDEWWREKGNAIKAFSNLPFNEMWIEFDEPNVTPELGGGNRLPVACTFHLVEGEDDTPDFAVVTVFMSANTVSMMDADTGGRGNIMLPMAVGGVSLDPDDPQIPRVGWTPYHWGLAVDCVLDALNIAAMVGQFLNCRNVELVEVLPASIASNPKKRRKRLSNPSRTKYRVIKVNQMGRKQTPHERAGAPGSPRRQHMRRGHFKTYEPDAPLFGKIAGTFWWGPALCGEGGHLEQAWDMGSLVVKPEEVSNE